MSLRESVPSLRALNEFSDLAGGDDRRVCAVAMTLMERAPLKLLIVMDADTRERITAATIGEKAGGAAGGRWRAATPGWRLPSG